MVSPGSGEPGAEDEQVELTERRAQDAHPEHHCGQHFQQMTYERSLDGALPSFADRLSEFHTHTSCQRRTQRNGTTIGAITNTHRASTTIAATNASATIVSTVSIAPPCERGRP